MLIKIRLLQKEGKNERNLQLSDNYVQLIFIRLQKCGHFPPFDFKIDVFVFLKL